MGRTVADERGRFPAAPPPAVTLERGGCDLPRCVNCLREALAEARSGQAGRVHTPEQVLARRRGRPVGSVAAVIKEPVKLRLDPDVLAALRATGDGWQTRINEMLRASLSLAGRLG